MYQNWSHGKNQKQIWRSQGESTRTQNQQQYFISMRWKDITVYITRDKNINGQNSFDMRMTYRWRLNEYEMEQIEHRKKDNRSRNKIVLDTRMSNDLMFVTWTLLNFILTMDLIKLEDPQLSTHFRNNNVKRNA